MNVLRSALSIGAVALFSGCGGSQLPIGAQHTRPQTSPPARSEVTDYKVVYSFGGLPDGSNPYAGVIDVRGTLYGTTENGGSCHYYQYTCGTVFSITPDGSENVLHTFGAKDDGSSPSAGLIDVAGALYGTTSAGGTYGLCRLRSGGYYFPCGTVFSITPSGAEKVLHSFGNGTDGLDPVAPLIEVHGTLYGTTEHGGRHNRCEGGCGTIFSVTPGGTEKALHSFGNRTNGVVPLASLIDVNGTLYGTTGAGGAYGGGTVFSIAPSGREKVLHSFGSGSDGAGPSAALIDVDGTLYGTTGFGGRHSPNSAGRCGTVFSITPSGSEKVLHAFRGRGDGADPVASLIEVNGTLYGTTEYGGAHFCDIGGGCGTIFSMTPSGSERVLHSFRNGGDGTHPAAALTDVEGILYGTTSGGGTYNRGTVFSLKP